MTPRPALHLDNVWYVTVKDAIECCTVTWPWHMLIPAPLDMCCIVVVLFPCCISQWLKASLHTNVTETRPSFWAIVLDNISTATACHGHQCNGFFWATWRHDWKSERCLLQAKRLTAFTALGGRVICNIAAFSILHYPFNHLSANVFPLKFTCTQHRILTNHEASTECETFIWHVCLNCKLIN